MKLLRTGLILIGVLSIAGCALPHEPAVVTKESDVLIISEPLKPQGTLDLALNQFGGNITNVVGQTSFPVRSLTQGLAPVRQVADYPLIAMTEYRGWFWYFRSVDMVKNWDTNTVSSPLGGYAIRKGGREVRWWSMW
jgi:hypothetical protein